MDYVKGLSSAEAKTPHCKPRRTLHVVRRQSIPCPENIVDDLLLEKNGDCTQFLKPVEPPAAASGAELPPSTAIVGPVELFRKVHNNRSRSESEMASQQQTHVSENDFHWDE